MLFLPNCPDPDENYCKGYVEEKIEKPNCPCLYQNGKKKEDMLFPPNCSIVPPIDEKFCVGYEKEKIKKPKCPCSGQNGKEVKDMLFPPNCPTEPTKCEGWEHYGLVSPCPCPNQDKKTAKDLLLYAPNCPREPPKKVCPGYENKPEEEKKYEPDCAEPSTPECEGYEGMDILKPNCPCPDQDKKTPKNKLLFPPNCAKPVYCKGYEKEQIEAPCPCPNQQGLKDK